MLDVFNSGEYNFLYTAFAIDQNPLAVPRIDEFNQHWLPTCYFDAGYYVADGMTQLSVWTHVVAAGAREVPELDLDVSVDWLGSATLDINVNIVNNFYLNIAPEVPETPKASIIGVANHTHILSTSVIDPEADEVYYQWDWGNGEISDWLGPYNSGDPVEATYMWTAEDTYPVQVKAKDSLDLEGPWSEVGDILISGKCGDANDDGNINVGDAVTLLNHVFKSTDPPDPLELGDANCDNTVNIGDAVRVINNIFNQGPVPGCQL